MPRPLAFMALAGLIVAGCSGGEERRDTQKQSMPFAQAVTEFNERAFRLSLEQQRKEQRTYGTGDFSSSASLQNSGVRVREFDESAFRATVFQTRSEERARVIAAFEASSRGSYNHANFLARMDSLSSVQAAASSSSSSVRRSGLFDWDERSSASSSSRSSIRSFLATPSSRSSSSSALAVAQCGDAKDNNSDGKIDAEDPDCHSDGNASYLPSYDYRRTSESAAGLHTATDTESISGLPVAGPSLFATRGATGCNTRSAVSALGPATTGNRGFTIPGIINGECPAVGAIFRWNADDNSNAPFGSMNF